MRYLLTAGIILCAFFADAQTGNISGKITDSSGKKVLPLTTVTIFRAKDTTIITYRLTSESGEFKIPNLPYDVPLRLMATYSGYEAFRKDFIVKADQPAINFGTVRLTATSKQLDEVIVTAERPPVVIKRDTIEFNASAFKTLPTALLEDLLKKLPGITVDENGDITVNGQKVNRILVDGKRFFGDDPKMATKNLPSNMVDKVQVMDDKDEIAQNNDGDMSKIGKVINLTLKKNIKKALFGKLYGGVGTNERYEVGGIINTFRDTLQMSMLAFSNNVNRASFTMQDVTSLGGFNRSGINGMGISSNGGFAINNISFGGFGSGLTTANGAGININHSPSKKMNLFLQYFFGGSRSVDINKSTSERFFGDTVLSYKSGSNSIATTNGHTINFGGNVKADSLTNINFDGSVRFNTNTVNVLSGSTISNNKFGPASDANGALNTDGRSDAYNYYIYMSHRFSGKKRRTLSMSHSLSYTRNPVDNINENINNFLYPSSSVVVVNQLRNTNSPNTSGQINANYSELITPKLTLRLSERIDYTNQAQLVSIYAKHNASGFYDSLNTFLSNDLRREHTRWNNQLSFSYQINKVSVNFGSTLFEQWVSNQYKKGGSSQLHYSNILFNTGFNWKRINVSLGNSVSVPSINYLNPVTDNSNPFYIVNGNPNLRQSKTTNLNVNGSAFDVKRNVSYNFNGYVAVENDIVIQSILVNSTGVQISTPINADRASRYFGNFSVNKQFKKNPKFIFSADAGMSFNGSTVPMMFNSELSDVNSLTLTPRLRFTFNWHDVVEFNPLLNVSFRKNTYSSPKFTSTDYTTQSLQAEIIVRAPKKLVWETNVAYKYTNNLAPGLPKTNIYWNAAVTLLMFKQDKGQLKFAVYDILNSNNNVYRSINGNAITDGSSLVLQRYMMLTYSYNIRSLAGQSSKVGGKPSTMFFF